MGCKQLGESGGLAPVSSPKILEWMTHHILTQDSVDTSELMWIGLVEHSRINNGSETQHGCKCKPTSTIDGMEYSGCAVISRPSRNQTCESCGWCEVTDCSKEFSKTIDSCTHSWNWHIPTHSGIPLLGLPVPIQTSHDTWKMWLKGEPKPLQRPNRNILASTENQFSRCAAVGSDGMFRSLECDSQLSSVCVFRAGPDTTSVDSIIPEKRSGPSAPLTPINMQLSTTGRGSKPSPTQLFYLAAIFVMAWRMAPPIWPM